jgi:polyisoprenoid-binding protein YceI
MMGILRMSLKGLGIPVVAILLVPAVVPAQQKLTVDPAKSEVHFTLGDTLHTVHGTFRVQQGEVGFNPSTGEASGSIAVDALSGDSGNSTRDKRMTKEELKADSYKAVTFAPTRFTGKFNASGDSTLQVYGVFTILGVAHEIDVPMQVQVNGSQLHGTGTFVVPYVKWGMKDPSTLMLRVGKEVQIDLLLTETLQR